MKGLPSQNALILLRSSFGASRVNYLLRCSPCHEHPGLVKLDGLQRAGLESLVNCSVNDLKWLQATIPIRDGGLGILRVVSLASSAYLASAASTLGLHSAILSRVETPLVASLRLCGRHGAIPCLGNRAVNLNPHLNP